MHGHYDLLGSLVIFPTVDTGPGLWSLDTGPGPGLGLNIALSGDGTSQQRAAGTHPRMQIARGARHSQNNMGHGDEILNFKVL